MVCIEVVLSPFYLYLEFGSDSNGALYGSFSATFDSELPSLPKSVSDEFIELRLQIEPSKKRWFASKLFSHPFICKDFTTKEL
ncbi:hypothetical protein G4B88_007724 [Cannabis sativa]|uniref:Uncharacterized protein n=1 Tax=Cannabis sativa TaxID=3483 RepID=A0A7J6HGG4_CANSA|nr:hypothetical protein G4B88_007724 [Cannabis sativa]